MQRDRSGWIIGLAFFLFFFGMYCWNSYNEIFEHRRAYLYHPDSDRLYSMAMGATLDPNQRWEPFVPFSSLFYGDPMFAEYMGELKDILREMEADRKLSREDFDAWLEKHQRDIDMILSEMETNEYVFWYVDYYPRHDIEVLELLPTQMKALQSYLDEEPSNLYAVDAVIVSRSIRGEKPEIEVLEKALLIRGRAAYAMSEMFQ